MKSMTLLARRRPLALRVIASCKQVTKLRSASVVLAAEPHRDPGARHRRHAEFAGKAQHLMRRATSRADQRVRSRLAVAPADDETIHHAIVDGHARQRLLGEAPSRVALTVRGKN